MDLALALRAFARTVERGSVTAAARDLGLSQPAVSKLLRNLEAHVRVRLMERNARSLRPTLQGLQLYEATSGALATIDGAIETLRAEAGAITGRLRLHGPVCLGERRLHAIVAGFQALHPDVSVRLTLENRVVDLIHEGIDLAVGMGRPTAEDVVLRRIGMVRRILVAAPAYLDRRGVPRGPDCLADHALLATDTVLDRGNLILRRGAETRVLAVEPILTTNNAQVLLDAILAGRGVGTAQVQLVAEALIERRLVRVLPEHEIPATELTLAYPSARLLRPTVRAFIDYAVPALCGIEGIDPAERPLTPPSSSPVRRSSPARA